MEMNPRTRRRRSTVPRSWSGPRPSTSPNPRPARRRRSDPSEVPTLETQGAIATLESVLLDFSESWGRGEQPRAEGYLGLLTVDDKADLIYHEYCLAEAANLEPDPVEYLRRFPEQSSALERLFALHQAVSTSRLRQWVEPSELPEAGDAIGPYELIRKLGHGSFAKVFLAEQADLGDRLVVVKVSTRPSSESRLLAQARHPHIVEVLRQAEANDGDLHLVCMPFLGGATLASVLEQRRKIGRRPRSGRDLLGDLDRVSAPEYPLAELSRPAREVVDKLSYPQALAWMVARLAEALDHAHRRGVVHGDLKPSNILITAEGSPMLFDFNLAVDWREADADGSAAEVGGTLAYMAPERLVAIASLGQSLDGKAPDRHRADLYALGLVLLEALTGRGLELPQSRPGDTREFASRLADSRRPLAQSLRARKYRGIPSGLRSILAKCLTLDPLDRYARGNELADDLDRWQANRPLAFAEEDRRSGLARRVRHSRGGLVAGASILAVALAIGLFSSALMAGSRRDQAMDFLAPVLDRPDLGAFGVRKFGRWSSFDETIDPAVLAARHLARYGVETDADWRGRDAVRWLPTREREELEAWLFEQVLRLSVALRDRPESPTDWRRALRLLDQAIAQVSLSALRTERIGLRAKLKLPSPEPEPLDTPRPPRWLEDYLAGVAAEPLYAREALSHYRDVLDERPEMFWAHYRAASVSCRIDEYPEAVEHMRRCVARRPKNPALHTFLATFLFKTGNDTVGQQRDRSFSDAMDECNRALDLNSDYAEANSMQARILKASGQSDSVHTQVGRFALLTRLHDPAGVSLVRMNTKLHDGPNYDYDTSAITALARKALVDHPEDQDTRAILASGLVRQDQGSEAIAAFDRVLEADPDHLRARFERASLLHTKDPAAAIAEYSRLIDHPRFEEVFREQPMAIRAYHHVATNLLEQERVAEALEVAHRSLAQVERSRSFRLETIQARFSTMKQTGLSPRGETYYLLARIHAVAARSDKSQVDQVVSYLDRSFQLNSKFQMKWFLNDPKFNDLRPEILKRLDSRPVDR